MAPETCPNCGAEVPPKAKACPECGADEQTGWSEAARTAGLDLPDENFDYDDFVKREFGEQEPGAPGDSLVLVGRRAAGSCGIPHLLAAMIREVICWIRFRLMGTSQTVTIRRVV